MIKQNHSIHWLYIVYILNIYLVYKNKTRKKSNFRWAFFFKLFGTGMERKVANA